ncbi:uncharacterized protein LOC132713949 isoform X3 [Ruditapes philippinarum]|uniref:uncharacterized protein LOC132713949 isoform X3 n=1 Tax=Ruditapes philippinarum TaxID=129788 RepID=UPI00295AC3C2|nr:uncharacterized protein LOC132713949 isoform X3 [Ruditapes philippinarum]
MKKYLQYNTSHYREAPTGIGVHLPKRQTIDTCQNEARVPNILDLSGRPNIHHGMKATEQKEAKEQEAALDLSKYGRQESQEEALDLSKPCVKRPERPMSQSYPQTHSVNQSQQPIQTPPATRHSKSPAGQPYSLLQAALNSSQPNAGLNPIFERIGQSTAVMLDQRAMIFSTAGMPVTDYGRTIKPFSSLSSRPLGITVPHMTPGAVIQGMHKPIAITTPQPHNSSVNTKSQTVSDASVSVTDASHSIPSTSSQGFLVSQSNYSSGHNIQISRQLNSGKIGNVDSIKYSPEILKDANRVERYLIQPPKGLNNVGNINVVPTEVLAGFSCNQCVKTFKTKAALKLHTTVHKTAEERQYACTICSRRFLHRHHLVVHQRKHSGEKPFKCTACSKTFMAIFLLHKHLRKHARETGPVSQISTDQLKQLHDKKLLQLPTSRVVSDVNTAKPPSDSSSVIVLDDDDEEVVNATVEIKVHDGDEGKLDRKRYERHKNKQILDMFEKDPSMILEKLKADLMKNKTEFENQKHIKTVTEETVEIIKHSKAEFENKLTEERSNSPEKINTNIDKKVTENNEQSKVQEDTDYFIKSEDVDRTYNYIIKDSNYDEVNVDMGEKEAIKQEVLDDIQREESIEKQNPFPVFESDDEVELDFTTGELKVVGKRNMYEVDMKENGTDTEMTNDANIESENKVAAIEIEVKNENCFENNEDGDCKKEIDDLNKTLCADNENANNSEWSFKKGKFDSNLKQDKQDSNFDHDRVEYNKELEKWENIKADYVNSIEDGSSKDDLLKEKNYEKSDMNKIEHVSGNIFEKFKEIRDGMKQSEDKKLEDKSIKDGINDINRDVEAILGVIKQKLCESEENKSELSKKPKLNEKGEGSELLLNVLAQNKTNGTETVGLITPKHIRHRKGKKKGKKVKCEICSRSFHSEHYLVLHMAVHKRNPMLQSLKKAKDYQMKAMGFLNKTNVTCDICKKVFKFQKSLNSHMRVHSEKMIQTKLYRKAFRDFMAEAAPQSSRGLSSDKEKSHTLNTDTESQFRRFSSGEQLLNKESKISAASLKRVSCDIENLKAFNEDQYDDPPIKVIIGDDNIKRYLCHACDNTYTTRQKLRMHALIHKDNCFLCHVCGKSFFRHITLEKHISTHRLPRPHVCETCKKSFIHRSSLMRHKVIHEKSIPSIKQQVADINFEMKMLDTYTMLRQERMQKFQAQKCNETSNNEPMLLKTGNKFDPLDLSVGIKTEDLGLPPVLSPVSAGIPNVTHASTWNLSPPLITHETNSDIGERFSDKTKVIKNIENDNKLGKVESLKSLEIRENRKRRTESTCSDSDMVAVEGHQVVQKRSRKTRVYQTSCRVCKEVFPNVMLLKSHMVVHNTVETHLYECHICRHRFTQSCSLLRHLKTSCQENRMKCVPCGRTFHRRNTFDQHMRLHQGGPPNLDGSFFDKRLDEAEVIEERESDIENNNLAKIEGGVMHPDGHIPPLRLELINMIEKDSDNNVTVIKHDGNDSDSDARTYLYSEGEVHSRYNSDFSDNDWSPPQSPRKPSIPQDLSVTSGNMTLNLLSAVCSDIINAEKEQEVKRKEMEEKQKELETIEILANLKRGAMQKSASPSSADMNVYHVAFPFTSCYDKNKVPSSTQSESTTLSDLRTSQHKSNFTRQSDHTEHLINDKNKMEQHSDHLNFDHDKKNSHNKPESLPFTSFATHNRQNLPSVVQSIPISTVEPKIPTVVLEVSAEAERKRRQRVESTWQEKTFNALTVGKPNVSINGPHSVSAVPPSSVWNAHHNSNIPHSVADGQHSSPIIPLSSAINQQLSPFISQSSPRSPHTSMGTPQQSADHLSPVIQNMLGRSPHFTCSPQSHVNDPHLSKDLLHQEMSQMKMHYPAIQERLSLLMKAQVPTNIPGSSHNTSAQSTKTNLSESTNSHRTFVQSNKTLVKNVQNAENDVPQDLSVKKFSQEHTSVHSRSLHSRSLSTDLARLTPNKSKRSDTTRTFSADMPVPLTKESTRQLSLESNSVISRPESSKSLPTDVLKSGYSEMKRSESVPLQQPPLVPMLQCNLCSRVLYNKTDLHLHMMEHGRSAGAVYKMLQSNKVLLEQKRPSIESPLDFTKAGPSNGFGHISKESKQIPPTSLDLSTKKSEKPKAVNLSASQTADNSPGVQSKLFMPFVHKASDKLSPMSSSDQSDSLSSPSTPSGSSQSAASLDALRQELRMKIYARRRSQGLDELKVEFKPPEPTEMTESEKLKLNYRRECNRQAAQRSRMRKKDLVDSLLEKLSEMPNVNPKEKKGDP